MTEIYKKYIAVIMGAELSPAECHRSALIGEALEQNSITVLHITESGKIKTHKEVICEVTGGLPSIDLFGNKISHKSIRVYKYIG